MAENAYVFYHPQYGGLRVVYYDGELFFCLEDLVAITSIGRETLFPVLANTEGKVVEMYVEAETKKVPKDFTHRLFFGEFFGNADKVKQKSKIAWRSMIFVDSQVVRDMTIGCSKDPERKLFYKWVKDFIQPVMEDKDCSPIPRLRWCVCRTKMSTELTESKVERCSVFSYSVLRSCYFVPTDST